MQAVRSTISEDLQILLEDVEDYLVEGLKNESLSAEAREERDAVLSDIQQFKERYHWGFLPRGVPAKFGFAQGASDDSQTWNVPSSATSEASFPSSHPENGAENNSQKATQEQGGILKQGYLEKKSKDAKIFGSEWQKRWCTLDPITFYYYANEKSKQPKGMFPIKNYRAQMAPYLRKDARRDCCFELSCPGKRTYEFTAVSPEEAEDWVDQILFLLRDMRSFVIPCEEEDDDDKETYDDIDSFDSPTVTLHQDTSLNLEEDMEKCDESIYEVLPDEDLDLLAEDDENGGSTDKTGFKRSYANYYQGLWDCSGSQPDELSFQRGDLIYIISKEYNMYGWWVGELDSVVGIVPKEYLMPAYEVEER
ncbi:src kinase-associated phosphoprotein 1 [Hemicordylus capensis]|uniref:src kinase-associated phosphoprotein 1 n=1 Tax=Hemicordylus capensis TaxID=884348 RepID=UPI002302E924|nr:src kinase-associated phosphoprotein 1 [Hemicordylus capensis]